MRIARRRARRVSVPAGVGIGAAAAGLTVAVGAVNGAYFPTSWGWTGLALAWAALVSLLTRRELASSPLAIAFLTGVTAFVGWVGISTLWSADPPQTVLEVERDVVYVAGAIVLLLVPRERRGALLAGCLGGIVVLCGYALLTRLLPDRLGVFDPVAGYRLSTPLGYWNALALFAAMGTLLALGFVAAARTALGRALAGASLMVLLPTLQFTFSRGGWIALGVGLAFAFAVDPRRLRLLAAAAISAPAPALAVAVSWHSRALTTGGAQIAAAAREGHRVAAVLLGLCVVGGAAGASFGPLRRRVRPGAHVQRLVSWALAAAVVVAAAGAIVAYGSPVHMATRAWDSFSAPPRATGSNNLNARLFNFSGSGRVTQWRVALDDYRAHPLLGSGAGSYEQYWNRHRPVPGKIRDVHNLYLEVLAELGPVGLGLLVLFLGLPLVALRRARHNRWVPYAAGAYVAYLTHAAIDWDWEMVVLTLLALACGTTLLAAAGPDEPRMAGARIRAAAVALSAVAILVAFVGLGGNIELSRTAGALRAGDWRAAERHAGRAHTWAPWSAEPLRLLGEARLAEGKFVAARDAFRSAIARDTHGWELWFDLARASSGARQRAALDRASRLNPRSPEVVEFRRELAQGWVLLDEVKA
jgi:O-antigen ligase